MRLIKDCGRLIVLDAYIDDNDVKLLNQLRGRDIHFIRNTYKPHQNKSINVFTTRNEFNENFNNFINGYVKRSKEERLNNRFVVVCQWRSDVEK